MTASENDPRVSNSVNRQGGKSILFLQRLFLWNAGVGNDRLISVCVCGCTCIHVTLILSFSGPHLHFDSVHHAGESINPLLITF